MTLSNKYVLIIYIISYFCIMLKNELAYTISESEFIRYKKWWPSNLFSSEELKLYIKLLNFFTPKNIFVLAKVRLADLVKPAEIIGYWEKQKVFMTLSQKHIDYVLTDCKWKILCLIELDWENHKKDKKTIKNDEFKNNFFKVVNLPLFRIRNYVPINLLELEQSMKLN